MFNFSLPHGVHQFVTLDTSYKEMCLTVIPRGIWLYVCGKYARDLSEIGLLYEISAPHDSIQPCSHSPTKKKITHRRVSSLCQIIFVNNSLSSSVLSIFKGFPNCLSGLV